MASRIAYQNLLTQDAFGGFSTAGGAVSMLPSGWSDLYAFVAGRVTFATQGTYTGTLEADYVVEIQSSTDGTFPNSRWRWSDTGGAVWNQSNLTPVSGTWVTLNNGLDVRFTDSGGTPQFVAGDYWYARVLRPYGLVKALDGSRNTEYRSGTLPTSGTLRIGFDLGSAQQPTLAVIDDHTLPSNATATWFAHATTLYTESGGFSQAVPWAAGRMPVLISSSAFRYWWLRISVGATAVNPLRVSELFLGPTVTFARAPVIGATLPREFLAGLDVANRTTRGPHPRVYEAEQAEYTWRGALATASGDGGKLDAALDYAARHASYTMPPFWFLLDDADLTTLRCYGWAGGLGRTLQYIDRYEYRATWAELIRTVAS